MDKQVMVCGVDCRPGDSNCNNYCNHDKNKPMADSPLDATETMILDRARDKAHRSLDAAEKAWYEYAGLCNVGTDRERAFDVYQDIRLSRRISA